MSFRKKIFVIFINLLFLFLILFIFDFAIYNKCLIEDEFIRNNPHRSYFGFYTSEDELYTDRGINNHINKKTISFNNINSKNFQRREKLQKGKDIVLFGCSYTYGTELKDYEAFDYKLQEYTKRRAYNLAIVASGPQHMLHLLKKDIFNIGVLPKIQPEYAIYTYIPSHIQRANSNVFPHPTDTNDLYLKYKLKNNKIEHSPLPFSFLGRTFILKSIYYDFDIKKNKNKIKLQDENFKLINSILLESRKLLKEKYPDIKFVILRYQTENDENNLYELPEMWEILKSEGFIILDTEELIGRKFKYSSEDTAKDGYHPSAKVWDMLIPKIVEKLNL